MIMIKQETLEEVNWKVLGTKTDTFYNGAKWQQEKSYSEEEISPLIEILKKCKDYFLLKTDESSDRKADAIIDVLEQFEKK